jgi:hypothetical protein
MAAMAHSVAHGFGTETDVRDCLGRLVVSHDPAMDDSPPWADVIAQFDETGLPLAVNVKADGLSFCLAEAFAKVTIDWFAFDMSGPETVRYAHSGLPFLTRHSDVEPQPILYDSAQGVWLDGFNGVWFDNTTIDRHLAAGKRVCVVSPELHGREPSLLWDRMSAWGDSVMLCTDLPDKASAFFSARGTRKG